MTTTRTDYAGKTVVLNDKAQDPVQGAVVPGNVYRIEGYWDVITGGSWMDAHGNPAALQYAMRAGFASLPIDNNVVYGKIGPFGHLVHVSELGDEVNE